MRHDAVMLVVPASVWLAFVVPLAVAAIGRHRLSTKLCAVAVLAVVLLLNWLLAMIVLAGDDSLTFNPLQIALPLLIFYLAVTWMSFRRKVR